MKAYIVWETKDDRPLIGRGDFGTMLVFIAKENAQAYVKDLRTLCAYKEEDAEVREVEITL